MAQRGKSSASVSHTGRICVAVFFLLFTIRTKKNTVSSVEVKNIERNTTGDYFKRNVIKGLTTMYV